MEGFSLDLLTYPFGIGVFCLFVSDWVIKKFDLIGRYKVFMPWVIGIVLSGVMLLAGKYFDFGAYKEFVFHDWKDWAVFAVVAVSPGMMSNGLFSSKLLEKLLSFIKK